MSYPDIATTALAPLPLTKTSEGKTPIPGVFQFTFR